MCSSAKADVGNTHILDGSNPRSSLLADDSKFYGLAATIASIFNALGPGGDEVMKKLHELAQLKYERQNALPKQSEFEYESCRSEDASQKKFIYRPLEGPKAIRILILHPGDPLQPLIGTIQHDVVCEQGPSPGVYFVTRKYEAISYVWGSGEKSCSILLNGYPVMITRSLFNALIRFRLPNKDRRMWADSLCINQEDSKEKATQVALMPQIYTFAAEVLVHLGEQDTDSEFVPQLIKKITRLDFSGLPKGKLDSKDAASLGLPPPDDRSWKSIVDFFCRPWFSRVWIMQEVILARQARFFCGGWELKWRQVAEMGERFYYCLSCTALPGWNSDFMRAQQGAAGVAIMHGIQLTRSTIAERLCDLDERVESMSPPSRTLTNLAPDIAAKRDFIVESCREHPQLFPTLERLLLGFDSFQRPTMPILKLLGVFSTHEATIPQDRLYALVGLAGDMDLDDFPPDYNEPEYETNARFSRKLIEKGQGMDVLYHATKCSIELNIFLPSWSPYWTSRQTYSSHWLKLGWAYAQYPGGFDGRTISTDFVTLVDGKPSMLKIHGCRLDRLRGPTCIAKIGLDGFRLDNFPARAQQFFKNVSRLMEGTTYFTGESWLEVQCRTLIADRGRSNRLLSSEATKEYMEAKDRFTHFPLPEDSPRKSFNTWANAWFNLMPYYAACKTSKGYVGLVPEATSENDEIVMIQGSDLPFVLRPLQKRPGFYNFIGGCYVHGMMKGEAWNHAQGQGEMFLV